MDRKKLFLLIGALFVAAITALLARNMFAGGSAPAAEAAQGQPAVTGPQVLVATRSLPVGTIITPDSVRFQPWPAEMVEEAYFIQGDDEELVASLPGTVVRHAITAGQPLTQGSVVRPGDRGFLAAALGPGMRAVTVPVSALTGVAGFVFPGDRVDLVLTQQVEGEGRPLKVSETIIRNLRVLATDQRVTPETGDDGQPVPVESTLVTLEVTPSIAEKVAVAQTIGTISLSLRSISDNMSELEEAIASGEITLPDTDDPREEAKMLARIAAKPVDGKSSFATGADVSRFQRRTVPPQQVAAPAGQAGGPGVADVNGNTASGPTVTVSRGTEKTEVPVGRR